MLSKDCNHSGFQAVGALFLIALQLIWQERNGVKTVGRIPNIVKIGRWMMSELKSVIPRIKRPPLGAVIGQLFSWLKTPVPLPKALQIAEVSWCSLMSLWVKFHSEGAASSGSAAAGGIFRSHLGQFEMGFSVHLGSKSNNFAELDAVFFGIQAALDAGFPLRSHPMSPASSRV